MDRFRGILMLGLGAFAIYRGFMFHSGQNALVAFSLGMVSIAVGVWRLTRKPPQLRR